MFTSSEIRRQFLDYFVSQGHREVASAPLVPKDDPTLLFTNAGMVQFKAPLLGLEKRDYNRAVTSQKCFRASGKHNDLENVGFTARHHTFFEMLGNFSFGNYFKEGAIEFCWELLTQNFGLDPDKLWVSVHHTDDEAEEIWRTKIGVPAEKIVRLGDKDNFWAMGDTGPCGPCSEVHIDQGSAVPCPDPDNCGVECECDRFLELWNLVFMQYDRDAEGNMTPLPAPSIDTGLGLERISAVLQGVYSNYETDLFTPMINAAAELAGITYDSQAKTGVSLRVIADHLRALCFLIGDGILPSNEGRGYLLRRVLRRAVRHGRVLGLDKPFLAGLVPVVGQVMGDQYPEIVEGRAYIQKIVEAEETRFADTLDTGLKYLGEAMDEMRVAGTSILSGEAAFKLYDTYGFPKDTMIDVLRDEGLQMDEAGFEAALNRQKDMSRAAWKGSGEQAAEGAVAQLLTDGVKTEFVGYDELTVEAEVIAVVRDGQALDSLNKGETGQLITDKTPFYAQAGGQVGDIGWIDSGPQDARSFEARVTDVVKFDAKLWVHQIEVATGQVKPGDRVTMTVHPEHRTDTMANHTATHLLHEALRTIAGEHVKQAGSLVSPERLRFDFTHFEALTDDQLKKIEDRVNLFIWFNEPVFTQVMSMDEAQKTGAVALFEERYGETVRVINIGEGGQVSRELCGGTHCHSTGMIGLFKILSEESVAAGVRRIEAVTRMAALNQFRAIEAERTALAKSLKARPGELVGRAEKLLALSKAQEKEIEQLKAKLASAASADLMAGVKEVNGIPVLARRVEVQNPKELRDFGDKVRDRMESGVALLGATDGSKAFLLALVTKDLQGRIKAGDLVKAAAQVVGGGGGGRPDMAQAGGSDPSQLDQALAVAAQMAEKA